MRAESHHVPLLLEFIAQSSVTSVSESPLLLAVPNGNASISISFRGLASKFVLLDVPLRGQYGVWISTARRSSAVGTYMDLQRRMQIYVQELSTRLVYRSSHMP